MSDTPKESFFDFREKLAAKPAAPALKSEPLTVSQLTSQIERALKAGLPGTIHVKGEVSNFNRHRASGHLYFTLKDVGACIDCVMFRSDAAKLKFEPKDGIELLVTGRVSIYPQRGRYQLYATALAPLGKGALELAFQQLCEKLKKEGLFEADRKKPLPMYPARIALVTSRSTAALHDMLKVLRRFPWIRLSLYHVPVQGDGSAERIAEALSALSRKAGNYDVIILSRGGGSLEDLWEFNEEIVARAIAASKIPIVTGIGHEVDVSVADLVADYHAHTPTEAAQVVVANWRTVRDELDQSAARLRRALRTVAQDARQQLIGIARHEFFRRPTHRVDQLRQLLDDRQRSLQLAVGERLRSVTARFAKVESRLLEFHPKHMVDLKRQRVDDLSARIRLASSNGLKHREQQLQAFERHLHAISPQAILRRGYSITTRKKSGAILRSAEETRVGERIITQFADGTVESTVEDQKQLPLFE